jgi:putative ABC transport system substrate-binding protein
MRRREFIAGLILASLVTQSFAAEKRISILHSGFPERTPIHVLIDALRALGHENGSTAVIEVLGGEGDAARLGALVNGIAARKPDVNRSFPGNAAIFDDTRQAAQARGVEVFSKEFDGAQDLAAAFDDIKSAGARAPIFNTDNQMSGRRKEIAVLALSHRLPSIHSFSPEVEDGGFMSYGPDLSESYRRAAALADRILKGSSPADLPVEEPTQFSLGINLATAKALGVMIRQCFSRVRTS